jgi:Fe-S protein assembly co-chaperone HscB
MKRSAYEVLRTVRTTPRLQAVRSFATIDYFERLELPRSFVVEEKELKQSYRKLMATLHPDRHMMESTEAQDQVLEEASQVTTAYSILQNPHERAVHLLELMGRPLEEAASSDVVGMEFLMEIMELREEISETTKQPEFERLIQDNRTRMDDVGVKLAEAFDKEEMDDALKLTAQLQYWNRIDETLREQLEVR